MLRKALLLPFRGMTLISGEKLLFIRIPVQLYIDMFNKTYSVLVEKLFTKEYDVIFLKAIYTAMLGNFISFAGIPTIVKAHYVESEYISSLTYNFLSGLHTDVYDLSKVKLSEIISDVCKVYIKADCEG